MSKNNLFAPCYGRSLTEMTGTILIYEYEKNANLFLRNRLSVTGRKREMIWRGNYQFFIKDRPSY